jgi:hypothetical protein
MEYDRECCICHKKINFNQIPVPDADDIIMLNYHTPGWKAENKVVVLCSKECASAHELTVMGCVICDSVCLSDKWFIHMKFVNLGGWTSIRACCSDNCGRINLVKEAVDCEVRYSCWNCKKMTEEKMPRCSKCHLAYYCSVACQRTHWPSHKHNCR